MAKYGKSASKNVESTMRRKNQGTLKSGSGRMVTSPKQTMAIGLSEAREMTSSESTPDRNAVVGLDHIRAGGVLVGRWWLMIPSLAPSPNVPARQHAPLTTITVFTAI